MNISRIILPILLVCFLCQCKVRSHTKPNKKNTTLEKSQIGHSLNCIDAHYSHWRAGIESGGSGIDISMKCVVINPEITGFDSLVIQSISFPVQVSRKIIQSGNEPLLFHTGDTISLKSGKRENKSAPENLRALKGTLSGKLYYRTNSKSTYLEIPQFVEIPSVNRP